jgi:hypothetical protein
VQPLVQVPIACAASTIRWQPPAPQLNVHDDPGAHVMSHGAVSQWNVHGPSSHTIGQRPETHDRVQPIGPAQVHEPPLHVPIAMSASPTVDVCASKPIRPHAASTINQATRTDPA